MRRRNVAGLLLLGILAAATTFYLNRDMSLFQPPSPTPPPPPGVGEGIDSIDGVTVYNNGPDIVTSWGRHYDASGYYFGQKWQCVEFIKRYYFQAKGHRMPGVMGHAREFFDPAIASGDLNPRRGLIQFSNGGTEAPQPGDLLVWNRGHYGHVAIISAVTTTDIEFVQQNIAGYPRDRLPLKNLLGLWVVGEEWQPAGWLRLPPIPIDPSLLPPPDPDTPAPGTP